MKLASFNVENLFQRARAMNQETWAAGAEVLKRHAEMNRILGKATYTQADKARVLELMEQLGILKKDDAGPWVVLRQNRGHLVTRRTNGTVEVVADGRADWIGWLDLKYEPVDETATRLTARVIGDVDADVLGVVEAEHRPSLRRFCKDVMPGEGGAPYDHVMLIDGNDERGIDVAIMTRKGYDIVSICSHVDAEDDKGSVFSRDCAQYEIATPAGNRLFVLVNHFKSKSGAQAAANARRERQARKVKEIYGRLRAAGAEHVAVIGDLNDFPDSAPLKPLVEETDLADIGTHAAFDDGGFPGTFGSCGPKNKFDYLLLSPELTARVAAGGVFRKGMWPGVQPPKWEKYPEMEKPVHAASDHAAIWAELEI